MFGFSIYTELMYLKADRSRKHGKKINYLYFMLSISDSEKNDLFTYFVVITLL